MTGVTVGIDGLSPDAVRVLHEMRSHGGRPVRSGEILPTLGLTKRHWERIRPALLERGLMRAVGDRGARRYVPTMGETAGAGAYSVESPPSIRRPVLKPVPVLGGKARRILRARILDHLSRRPLDERTLAAHLNATGADVQGLVSELLASGKVRREKGVLRASGEASAGEREAGNAGR